MKQSYKTLLSFGAVALMVLFISSSVFAASSPATLTINATVAARAELVLAPTTINFADASPTTTASVPADNPVAVTARIRTGRATAATLTVTSAADLTAGTDTIPISNVSWTASGAPFIAGTMNKATPQSAATFANGSGLFGGTFNFFLANSWTYNTGAYTATVTYTLTAP
ncbi:MAG: hypothetical protein LAO21_15280 [Acidobacteriia bacterium]|nr:hypothetical protein [Terriglobia bacterium]